MLEVDGGVSRNADELSKRSSFVVELGLPGSPRLARLMSGWYKKHKSRRASPPTSNPTQ